MAAVESDPELVGAYGRWARVAPEGRIVDLYPAAVPGGDLFALLATYCVFAIHTCVVQREAVVRAGGFDERLRTCEDWDLWQRISRLGGRFAHVPTNVALYHLSATSASRDHARLLGDGLEVAERGHTPDPRLADLEQAHPQGAPSHGLAAAQAMLGCWSAGLAIAEAVDPLPLLDVLPTGPVVDLDAERAGLTLYESAIHLQLLPPGEFAGRWDTLGASTRRFFDALEERMHARGLAEQAMRTIERRLVLDCPELLPLTLGSIHATRVDLLEPLHDVACPPGVDRAVLTLTAGDDALGVVELPVVAGIVPADVIEDVDTGVAWKLLGHVFAASLYPGGVEQPSQTATFHDEFGWTVFLQELWGKESWTADAFYDPETPDAPGPELRIDGTVEVDVVDELPTLVTDAGSVAVTLRVGGRALGVVDVEAVDGRVESQRLRAALSTDARFELCRVAVAQALVGRPLGTGGLRELLRERIGERRRPGAASRSLLGRHPYAPIGSSGTRRAWLPSSIAPDVALLAAAGGQPYVRGLSTAGIVYAPDLIGPTAAEIDALASEDVSVQVPAYGRHHFEELLASESDPWQYESAYERRKYEHTLGLVPRNAKRALEIGCAEGHFTVDLARIVGELVAADLSEIALVRARARCAGLENVSFAQLDVAEDPLPGTFDVIVCSELLYYVGRERLPDVAAKLADGLRPGGALVHAHANLQVDEPHEPGFDWALPFGAHHIGEVLGLQRSLRLTRDLRTPFYRVQRYERCRAPAPRRRAVKPDSVPYKAPVAEVAEHFRWAPAPTAASHADERAETWHLPILMYHRVGDDGPDALARWRVGTESFARQLAYLADAGFRTVTLDEWRSAAERRVPLPGRAVVLTFDDGYVDFATNAWPLLDRHGFGAVVGVVADRVGGLADWDAAYGEPAPLLDWPALRDLAASGVEFASHSLSHASLTGLSLDDAARECARSRVVVERELGRRVTTLVYPHGATDPVIEHIAGGLGYVYGLTTDSGIARFRDRLLALPRQEITGDMSFDAFVRVLIPDP